MEPEEAEAEVPTFNARLVVRGAGEAAGADEGITFEIKDERLTIGRTPENGIQIDHPSVSATHAQIRAIEGRYQILDLGSRNGTSVNGAAVEGTSLKDGSRISIGGSGLFFTQLGRVALRPGTLGLGSRGVIMVQSGPSLGQSFPVGDQDMLIGREPTEGGVQLNDPQVDPQHALVRPTPDGCMIFDLGSSTGTKINDVPMVGVTLKNGDVIKLGMAELDFVQEEPS